VVLRAASIAALLLMVAGLVALILRHQLFAHQAPAAMVQLMAVGLMIWARLTFGRRSFHAAANPTTGGLVTTGPYAFIRHPIYAAVLYFTWAAALDFRTRFALVAALLVTTGAVVRILSEERLLMAMYPDYAAYSTKTARVVPFLL
jgi:protein-S-isoprenylcysteine O-methyltransferase Ste14